MTAPEIKVEYEALEAIREEFGRRHQALEQTLKRLQARLDELERDGWIGRGSEAFFREMREEVLPRYTRLLNALDDSHHEMRRIHDVYEAAEDTAAHVFDRHE
jgi:WXG100 family type VII secretion target